MCPLPPYTRSLCFRLIFSLSVVLLGSNYLVFEFWRAVTGLQVPFVARVS